MTFIKLFTVFAAGIVSAFLPMTTPTGKESSKPRTFLLKIEHLELTKKLWKEKNPVITQSMNALTRRAEKALRAGPYTVTTGQHLPPGGDPHDFFGFAPFYWPNPKTTDGFPWIRRYGQLNPHTLEDWAKISRMASHVYTLALAYYFTGGNEFASHASSLLRSWFIDKSTKMNPNVKFGKVVPGTRKSGYAVARFGMEFRKIYDAAGILECSSFWSNEDRKALRQWTREFMQWAETSRYGKKESRAKNNHGTFYDMIMALQAMYIGDYHKAKDIIQCYMTERIPKQFKPDGSQPFEMVRRNNYHYHIFNLEAAFDIAQLADHFDHIDIWTFETKKGAGLRRSFEFLFPYLINQWQWNHFKKKHFNIPDSTRFKLLRKASIGFNEPEFEEAGGVFPCLNDTEFVNLTHPNAAIKR